MKRRRRCGGFEALARFKTWSVTVLVLGAYLLFSGCSPDPAASRSPSESESAKEAALADLVRIDGRLHLKGSDEPFTGFMVDHYPDGLLKSRSALVEGRVHGISEGWHPNGVLEVREHFVDGVSHGERSRWFQSGARQSTVEIVEGKLHGLFQRWHESGALAERVEMRDGKPDGASTAYFPSGYLRAYVEMEEGRIVQQQFWEDGETRGQAL